MAKRSSLQEVSSNQRAWESLQSQGPRPEGWGLDYRLLRHLPEAPSSAKFLRRYVTLREALLRMRVESPAVTEQKPFIREGCSSVLASLGEFPWNYEKADESLREWCAHAFRKGGVTRLQSLSIPSLVNDSRPQVAAAAQLLIVVSRLIVAYADPRRFFQKIAPEEVPSDFDPRRLSEAHLLGQTLWRWGFGALWNPNVRLAFDAINADQIIEVLGFAEGRERYREGNPVGSGKGKPKKKRVDNISTKQTVNARATAIEKSEGLYRGGTARAIEEVARAENRSPAAIHKRISRASNK